MHLSIVENRDDIAFLDRVAFAITDFKDAPGSLGGDGRIVAFDAAAQHHHVVRHRLCGKKCLPDGIAARDGRQKRDRNNDSAPRPARLRSRCDLWLHSCLNWRLLNWNYLLCAHGWLPCMICLVAFSFLDGLVRDSLPFCAVRISAAAQKSLKVSSSQASRSPLVWIAQRRSVPSTLRCKAIARAAASRSFRISPLCWPAAMISARMLRPSARVSRISCRTSSLEMNAATRLRVSAWLLPGSLAMACMSPYNTSRIGLFVVAASRCASLTFSICLPERTVSMCSLLGK